MTTSLKAKVTAKAWPVRASDGRPVRVTVGLVRSTIPIETWSVALPPAPSVTVSSKVRVSDATPPVRAGAVKVGWAAVTEDSVTVGPPVCAQLKPSVWPGSASLEPLPSSVTVVPSLMPVWSGPASATGPVFVATGMLRLACGAAS